MTKIDDETLMAYADGMLDAKVAASVERRIAEDPEARRKIDIFRETSALAQRAFAQSVREPVPDRLVRVVTGGSHPNGRKARAPRATWRGLDWLGELARPALPIVASIALLMGLGGGYLLTAIGGQDSRENGVFSAAEFDRERLGRNLETAVSGRPVTWRSQRRGATIQLLVRTTFRNKSGEFCREYEKDLKQSDRTYHFFGIACRTGSSTWETRVIVAAPPAKSATEPVFRPAGDAGLAVIETALDGMIDGRPFNKEQEARMLAKGWKRNQRMEK